MTKFLKNIESKKIDLAIIATLILLFDVFSITFYISKLGTNKLHIQIIRFLITLIICYGLYQEKKWARWLIIIFGGMAAIYALFSLRQDDIPFSIFFSSVALIFIFISIYLFKRKSWR